MARGDKFRALLPWLCMNSEPFLRRYGDHLRPAELSGEDANYEWLLRFAVDFWNKYKAVPSYDALIEAWNDIPPTQLKDLDPDVVTDFLEINRPDKGTIVWALTYAERWIKRRHALALGDAISESLKDDDLERIARLVENSNNFTKSSTSEDTEEGEIFSENLEEIIGSLFSEEEYRADSIPIGLDEVDEAMGGGTCKGEFGVVVGATNAGKSQFLTAFSRNVWLQGHSVLYISLEDPKDKVLQTFLSGLLNMTAEQMYKNKEMVFKRTSKITSSPKMQKAKFKVVYWPAESKGVADIELLIDKEKEVDNVEYDFIFVDFGDLLKPERVRNNSRTDLEQGEVFLHLRRLAIKRDLRIWSGSQANRDAVDKAMIKLSNIGDAFAKVKHPDWVVLLGQNPDMASDHKVNVMLRKARKGFQMSSPVTLETHWEVNSYDRSM